MKPITPNTITCTRVGAHPGALTRGVKYEMLARDDVKGQVKIEGNNKRTRWYPVDCFDLSGGDAATLVDWEYDGDSDDERNGWGPRNNLIDVHFLLSNKERRWCTFVTPDYLKSLLEPRDQPSRWASAGEPGIYGRHFIIVRSVGNETVDWMLRQMDQQNELIEHSILLEPKQ